MKNTIFTGIIAISALASCSTVSSLMQNTFPYTTNFVIAEKTPPNTQLSLVGSGLSINQVAGVSNNVKDIKVTNATATVSSGDQSIGIFKSLKVYISSGTGQEILIANRENIADNIGNTIALDINNSAVLDAIMKSGNVQEKLVFELKSTAIEDIKLRTSLQFTSQPIVNQ